MHTTTIPTDCPPAEEVIDPRAAYRSLLELLRWASASASGRLDSDARCGEDFRRLLVELRRIVRPWLCQLAEAKRGRAAAEAAADEERGAFLRLSHTHTSWWQAIERAGIEIRPSLDGWSYRVPAIADTWDGPYTASDAALAAAIAALIARAVASD
ncbi:hypothetical protein K2Z83_27710 [Oscillochloris sp. ZM17-4]|uniref:hypothetical protein n=1 Tax=Oscillochloris sp. ZM17-4 TaxID=2866714 RepID=UPI001C72BE2E|nr:hypothetical protein [Oscillochloris sp. ZM17-4]MBX0331444.1 hypothetical protein [Oscillochloris sp. ZM17-4]